MGIVPELRSDVTAAADTPSRRERQRRHCGAGVDGNTAWRRGQGKSLSVASHCTDAPRQQLKTCRCGRRHRGDVRVVAGAKEAEQRTPPGRHSRPDGMVAFVVPRV